MTEKRKVKQVIVVDHSLQMNKGKFAVMVAHASVEASLEAFGIARLWDDWEDEGFVKICLQARDLPHLLQLRDLAERAGLITALITDAGCTVFKEPTTVALAIGPGQVNLIDNITKDLKLW